MDAFLIERLALALDKRIKGNTLNDAFTTSLHDLYLLFEDLAIKITFYQGQAYFQFPELQKVQKKNRLKIYKSAIGCQVTEIKTFPYDRKFQICLSNDESLFFYLFGRFSQVSHYQFNNWQETFPVKSSKVVVPDDSEGVVHSLELEELKFLPKEKKESLARMGIDQLADEDKTKLLDEYRNSQLSTTLFINKLTSKYDLNTSKGDEVTAEYSNIIEALDNYSRLYIAHQVYHQTKNQHLAILRRELKSLKVKHSSAEKRIAQLNKASSYREKADLLMANLWQIEKGVKSVELTSFDGERQVAIKLKPTLSPQDNASVYYRKSKNEGKQREYAEKHLSELRERLYDKQREIEQYEQLDSLKDLRKQKETKEKKATVRLPYFTKYIGDYEIRIGRGAKDNDELLRNHTTKSDIWLHAKDVSGSHVIIRNPAGAKIPENIIEQVASIAAYHSKAKNEQLAVVMYTERKYVRKPKGATPGLVKVDNYETVLIEPMDFQKM